MNKKLKLVIFSDIHYLDGDHKEEYNRKLTNLSTPLIEKLIDEINNKIKPDICICLGDFIEDTNNHEQDVINFKFIWNKIQNIKNPFYAVAGNHDLKTMKTRQELEDIMGYFHSTFSINIKNYHLIFLGLDVKNNIDTKSGGIHKTQFISKEDIEWLKEDLRKNKLPCLIFSHFGIAEDEMIGNWWFENYPEDALLKNRKELKHILNNDENVIAVFTGHQHWNKKIIENNIQYYVIGSLTENINNDGIPDGVYVEVDLLENKIEIIEKHIKI